MALSFRYRALDVAEAAAIGRNVMFEIDYAHLAAAGATTSDTATLLNDLATHTELKDVCYNLVSGFVGASITNLTIELGVTGNTDAFVPANEIATAGTEIIVKGATLTAPSTTTVDETYATNESTVLEGLRTLANQIIDAAPKYQVATTDFVAVFRATSANLSAMTAGVVTVFANVADLSKYRAP